MRELNPIDMHTHIIPTALMDVLEDHDGIPRIVDRDGRKFLEYGRGSFYPITPVMTDIDQKLAQMDADGIAISILSVQIPGVDWLPASDGASVARDANDELLELASRYPRRLAGLATLPLQAPDAALAELDRAVGLGLKGTMVYSNVSGQYLDDEARRPVFAAAADLDVPILIHPTYPLCAAPLDVHALIPLVGYLFDTTTATLRLIFDGLYERHADIKLILAHVGSLIPYIVGRIDYTSRLFPEEFGALTCPPSKHLERLYVDTVSVWAPALQLALDYLGHDRVMFGTDHPFWEPSRTFDTLAELDLTRESATMVVRSNAERVFGLSVL